ncbi:MAG: trimethylamine methyltransferase family protein [Desulfobacterales bacterium]|nr:MAG: trimethylamine methyltransferase family protein [Desulfobacterales bacterium]
MIQNFDEGKKQSQGYSLNSFTDDELYKIHLATLAVLEKTGIFVETEEALDIFAGAGAEVDRKKKIVKIPPYVVDDAIRSAPSKIVLAGRNPDNDKVLETGRVHFTNFSEGVEVVDLYTDERREPTKADLADAARLVDYLSDIDVCEKAVGSSDVPQEIVPLHNAEAMLTNTTKHCCVGPGNGFLLNKLVKISAAIVGGLKKLKERPILSFTTCPVSPLQLIKECCEIIIESARTGSVINILSMAMAGGTSPVTLAGTLVTHNAEVLGGLTLNQLVSKGAPVIYGSSTTAMDLKLGTASVGTPECAMISGAVARLARYYALPSYVAGG